jgi:pimeloyl-ACP methyl ester carboxylesterase
MASRNELNNREGALVMKRTGAASFYSPVFVLFSAFVLVTMLVQLDSPQRKYIALDEQTRSRFGGSYIRLSAGVTHYELIGTSTAPVVCLVHGVGPTMYVWDRQVEPLLRAGYRVLRFDRYGTGLSDNPSADYTWELFDHQLEELLDSLHISGPIALVGRSFGAQAALSFTTRSPWRVGALVLVSSGLPAPNRFASGQFPFSASLVCAARRYFGKQLMGRVLREMEPFMADSAEYGYYRQLMFAELLYEGSEEAVRSMVTNRLLVAPDTLLAVAVDSSRATAFIWGSKDFYAPPRRMVALRNRLSGCSFFEIANAAHTVNFTHHEQFNQLLIEFLKNRYKILQSSAVGKKSVSR